jgi:Spy/CpxP family protein refolding chaperone
MTRNQVLPIASLLLGSCFALAQQAPPPPAAPAPPDSPAAKAHAKTIRDSRNVQYRVITTGEPGPRADLRIAPPGMWWKNSDLAQKISLTADQQKRMDDIFQQSRIQLIDLKANVEKQEVMLEPMLSANPPDTNKVLAQIDHVASARAELEKANARMLLGIRGVLSADQWTKLQAEQRENQRFMFRYKTGPGGPEGPGGPGIPRGPGGPEGFGPGPGAKSLGPGPGGPLSLITPPFPGFAPEPGIPVGGVVIGGPAGPELEIQPLILDNDDIDI